MVSDISAADGNATNLLLQCRLAGRYDNPTTPVRDYEFGYWARGCVPIPWAHRRVVVKDAVRVLDLPLRQTGLHVLTIEPLREMGG